MTTMTLGLAALTALSVSIWHCGSASVERSRPSDSLISSRPRYHIHRMVELRAVDHGAARALVSRLPGKLTDHGDLAAFFQRQDVVLVFEQHDRLLAGLLREGVVGFHIEGLALPGVDRLARGEHHVEQLVDPDVDLGLGDPAVRDRLHELARAVAAGGGHLEVGARAHALDEVVVRAPVGHDEAVEAPGVAQDLLQEVGVFVGVDGVDHIVGGHDGLGAPLAHGDLEVGEVDLAQGALVHDGVGGHAPQLRVVRGEVLRAGGHAVCLDAADVARGHLAREIGVLGEVFEVAPAEGAALDVEAGAEQHAHVLRGGLLAEHFAELLAERGVPGVGHGRGRRITGRGQGAAQAQLVAGALLLADAVRAVRQGHVFNAQPLHALGLPEVTSREQMCFLLQRQLFDQILMFQDGFFLLFCVCSQIPLRIFCAFVLRQALPLSEDGRLCPHAEERGPSLSPDGER